MTDRGYTNSTVGTAEPAPRAEEVPESDRVRSHTAPAQLREIDEGIRRRVEALAGADDEVLTRRIEQLDREWDMERVLEANAASLTLTGVLLGVRRDRRWLVLPAVVSAFLLQHALQGWCPPLPLFRRLGVRTRREIDAEKHALKALRGDYDRLGHDVGVP
jgi:hypothetical protein